MRWLLVPMLAVLIARPAAAGDNEPLKLFRDMEKKIKEADALRIAFDIEIRAVKRKEQQGEVKDKAYVGKGFLWLAKGNKAQLKISGEWEYDLEMELVSNGTQLKLAPGRDVQSVDDARGRPTPRHLHALLSTFLTRTGGTACSMMVRAGPGPPFEPVFLDAKGLPFDPETWWVVRNFKAGAAAKVGGRDAKVISFGSGGLPASATLWIDAKTSLPLKRVTEIDNLRITETYSEFELDPKMEAKAFALVRHVNDAEKLFRTMEEKIKAAKAVLVTSAIEGQVKEKGEAVKVKGKGSLLFTKDKKARLQLNWSAAGREVTSAMISDGKQLKRAESPEPLAKAEAQPTPANLHGLLSTRLSISGLPAVDTNGPAIRVVYFRGGTAEKVGSRAAKVVIYTVLHLGGTSRVTLWIDAKTLLPLKRQMVTEGEKGPPGQITELCNFDLNPKVDAGAFALPK